MGGRGFFLQTRVPEKLRAWIKDRQQADQKDGDDLNPGLRYQEIEAMARFSNPEQWQRLARHQRAELVAHQIEKSWWTEYAHRHLNKNREKAGGHNPLKSAMSHMFKG